MYEEDPLRIYTDHSNPWGGLSGPPNTEDSENSEIVALPLGWENSGNCRSPKHKSKRLLFCKSWVFGHRIDDSPDGVGETP